MVHIFEENGEYMAISDGEIMPVPSYMIPELDEVRDREDLSPEEEYQLWTAYERELEKSIVRDAEER